MVLVGVVLLLGVSACLTRGAGSSAEAGATIVSLATTPATEGLRSLPPKRCAFSLLSVLPERRGDGFLAGAVASAGLRPGGDDRLPESLGREVPERPPRAAAAPQSAA